MRGMDIQGARALKAQLEEQILALIRCFEKETGLTVDEVRLEHCSTLDDPRRWTAMAQATVEM
jgi:hypothetical protein